MNLARLFGPNRTIRRRGGNSDWVVLNPIPKPPHLLAAACAGALSIAATAVVLVSLGDLARVVQAADPPAAASDTVWLGRPDGATATEPIEAARPLVGMDIWLGTRPFPSTSPVIVAIAPIYAGAEAPKTGPYGFAEDQPIRIVARPGYAVAGIVGRATDRILGFQFVFMRLRDGAFDPKDQYESRWIGGRGAGVKDVRIAGDGKPIVGLIVRFGLGVNGFTLAQNAALLNPPTAEIGPALTADKLAQEVERRGGKVVRDPHDPAHPIVEVDFIDTQLGDADLAILHGQASLKRLDLQGGYNKFSDRGLAQLDTLRNLESINIEHNFGQAMGLPLHVRSLPHLKSLGLAHSNDGNQAPDAAILGTMTNLEELTISDAFSDASMVHLGKLINLRLLYIDDTPITDLGAERLRNLRKLRNLTIFSSVIDDDGLASLEDLHELDQLRLGGQELTSAMLEHVKAPNLKSISLSGQGFDDRVVPYLHEMDKLEDLHLRHTQLTDAGLADLNSLKHLVSLDLEQCSLTGKGLLKLSDLKDLKLLELEGNPIEDPSLSALKNFPELESLDLTMTHATSESLVNLKFVPKLRELSLGGVPLTDDALAHLEPLVNLEILRLPSTGIKGSGLPHLKHLPKLKHLELQVNPISDARATVLGEMPGLQDLNLEGTPVADATLAALAKLPNLESLLVPSTQITDRGVESLSTATKLRELNVSNPRITDAVVTSLLALQELRVLALNTSLVTDDGAQRLAALPNLRTLYIGATHTSRDTVRRIQEKSVKLKVFHDLPQFPDGRR